jgi:dihydrofolate reductase
MKISIIAALDLNRGIGKGNALLLSLSEDMQRFRNVTRGHPVIMGRRTFESAEIKGKPLPNKTNIVITSDKNYQVVDGVIVATSLNEAIEEAKKAPGAEEIFVIGGGQIYHQAISIADRLYITLLETNLNADTFFPDYSAFKKIIFEEEHKSGDYKFKFLTLER